MGLAKRERAAGVDTPHGMIGLLRGKGLILARLWVDFGEVDCKKVQKKCKKMQKHLHISKKSSTFVADLGIVPDRTIKTLRVMKKSRRTATLGHREKVKTYQVGNKQVIVWKYADGPLMGWYMVTCVLYPELAKLFQTEELAIKRAENIVSFHNRQLKLEGLQ